MKDKIFKAIKCVLFMLPFVFVGGTTLYTILNENAKDSYSDEYIESKQYITELNQFVANVDYTLIPYVEYTGVNDMSGIFYYNNISIDWVTELGAPNYAYQGFKMGRYAGYPTRYFIHLFPVDTNINYQQITPFDYQMPSSITFNFKSLTTGSLIPGQVYTYVYKSNTLDNAFEYGLSEFNDIGFGKIDFLEWFNDLFLNNNFNNVYSTFINSYLNYFLFVELVMFIPSVFHWVIHFFTEIGNNVISKSTDKKKGD